MSYVHRNVSVIFKLWDFNHTANAEDAMKYLSAFKVIWAVLKAGRMLYVIKGFISGSPNKFLHNLNSWKTLTTKARGI